MDEFQEVYMPVMRKSADLRNSYGEISEFCHKHREPVFITQNGEKDLAIMSVEIYEEIIGKRKLYNLLEDGLNDIKIGDILSEEEMDKSLDSM
jgi:PHD/YefM family antitoxin component YafN of YafNO toxin-antitoxin module